MREEFFPLVANGLNGSIYKSYSGLCGLIDHYLKLSISII